MVPVNAVLLGTVPVNAVGLLPAAVPVKAEVRVV
jgi:hypothetical protein